MRRFVTRSAAVAAVACLVGVGLAGAASAQELGLIYAAVIDQTGQPVTDLTPEEFQVTEDGNAGQVVSADVGTEPMKIALLVDNGRRISRGQAINPLRDGVTGFIENIPPEHEISLFTIRLSGGSTSPPTGRSCSRRRRTSTPWSTASASSTASERRGTGASTGTRLGPCSSRS